MKNRKPRKDGRYMVNVTFCSNEEDLRLLEYADSQGSFTSYVKRLIKDDMNKKGSNSMLEMLLGNPEMLKGLLQTNGETSVTAETPVEETVEDITEPEPQIDIDAMNELLEME